MLKSVTFRLVITVIGLALLIPISGSTTASAGPATTFVDPAGNPSWGRWEDGYRQALNYCTGDDVIMLHWQLVLKGDDPEARWEASEDHLAHTFTLDPYEHWNVPESSIKTVKLQADGRLFVTWHATYPDTARRPQMKINQAWVELSGPGGIDEYAREADQLRLVALAPCVPAGNTTRINRWAVVAGDPNVKPAP